jgi:hypothetical protein
MSAIELKTVKRFQQYSIIKSFPNYNLLTFKQVNYTFITVLGMVAWKWLQTIQYKVLSQHLLEETGENHKRTFIRTELVAATQIHHLPVYSRNTNHSTIMYVKL